MKPRFRKFLAAILLASVLITSCDTSSDTDLNCGIHNGHELFEGPQGGCYYINDNGNKTYVDRSECNC